MDRASGGDDMMDDRVASGRANEAGAVRIDGVPRPMDARFRAEEPRRMAVAAHCEALSRLLAAQTPAFDELAAVVMRDPALLHALLEAAPLAGQRLAMTLKAEITHRLEVLGPDLLRVWLMQQAWKAPAASAAETGAAGHALLVAECALHLALETRYTYPDEAYLAGLWHSLGTCTARTPDRPHGDAAEADAAQLAGTLAERCGAAPALCDAIAFHHALDEAHLAAHPLVRLVWSAKRLAQPEWQENVDQVAAACSLSSAAVFSLRTDVGFLAAGEGCVPDPALPSVAAARSQMPISTSESGTAMQRFAIAGLVRGAFFGLDEKEIGPRLLMACRLLCREASAPLLLVADESDLLRALPLCQPESLLGWYAELDLRLDDETSVVALAARSGTATSWFPAAGTPSRSSRDWHLARNLGRHGIACLPLHLFRRGAVAVLGAADSRAADPGARALLIELLTAAGLVVDEAQRRRAVLEECVQRVEERYRNHARRIAHEASSPLTLVASHLELLAQRRPPSGASDEDVLALQREVDRVASLLRRAGQPEPDAGETAECRVADVLQALRAAYEETLFRRRGIYFELRATSVPAVAMPASALKQVLLNLFRNAAEALQPGGRFVVTVPGVVLANGVPSVELRLIDNGPGLPPERQADLAAPRPSTKGDAHQGVGLSVVHELLAQWKATCLCRSQAGTGTSYQLFIPLVKTL